MNYISLNGKHLLAVLLIGSFLSVPIATSAQDDKTPENTKLLMHREIPDDDYLPLLPEDLQTSPPCRFNTWNFFTTQVNIDEDGQNIIGDAANEPSIAVDPTHPNRIVIGWRQFDNVGSNFRQAGYAFTLDGGENWTFPGSIDAGVFRSDPVLDVDKFGNFYYNSLTRDINDEFLCTVYKTEDTGVEWDEGTFAQGGDKQWMRIDNTGGTGSGHIYSFWTTYYSWCYPGAFTRSTDEGASYEDCINVTGELRWGTLAVGPDGELYIVGSGGWGGIQVNKSTNALDPSEEVTWESTYNVDLDGELSGWVEVNPSGLMGQAWIDVDKSNGPGRGYVYVLASVDRNSNIDPGDVMFARSTDGGETWDNPIRINDDESYFNTQWFGTMSVAPNGRIDVVWLDTRDATSNPNMSALYYSYSLDQGESWSVNQQLSDPFDPHLGWPQQEKMGDYYDMVSDNEGAHLAWAHTLLGEQNVNYGHITPLYTSIEGMPAEQISLGLKSFPNPIIDQTTIRYKINHNTSIELSITDVSGRIIKTITSGTQEAGTYEYKVVVDDLSRGIYYCHLKAGTKSETIKLMVVK